MKKFKALAFDPAQCATELAEFKALLDEKKELQENADILPFFKERLHLSAFVGSYQPDIVDFNLYAHEFDIFGDFKADLAIGNSDRASFCFVEFEDAKKDSIFKRNGAKANRDWGPRLEKGFSQIVDWFWKLRDMQQTGEYQARFKTKNARMFGVLVVGRSDHLEDQESDRLIWRARHVLIDSKFIACVTYDQLYQDLHLRLRLYQVAGPAV